MLATGFHDHQPITWWNRTPIYGTAILTALFALGVIVCAVLGLGRFPAPFAFMPPAFLGGAVWQPLTYAFADTLSFFTPLGLLCFYTWGVEIEKYLGRPRFFGLFGMLVLAQPIVCLAWWKAGWTAPFPGPVQFGNYEIMAAMLIGFATLYPNVEYLFGWVPLKWFAFVCFIAGSLMHVAERNWFGVALLWTECGIAFGYIRWLQTGGEIRLPNLAQLFQRKPKFRVLPSPAPRERVRREESNSLDEIDGLLDKISKSGMESLTARERAKLEKAREALMKKEPGHR